jgi:antitoxin (DNA-binding transcriptional repressor) of toxin-antitoxin stability system
MRKVKLTDARAKLSSVVVDAARGKPSIITRRGKAEAWWWALPNGSASPTFPRSGGS